MKQGIPDAVCDTYCGYDDCKGQDGDGWSDVDVFVLEGPDYDIDETSVHEYRCHACDRVWQSTFCHGLIMMKRRGITTAVYGMQRHDMPIE